MHSDLVMLSKFVLKNVQELQIEEQSLPFVHVACSDINMSRSHLSYSFGWFTSAVDTQWLVNRHALGWQEELRD